MNKEKAVEKKTSSQKEKKKIVNKQKGIVVSSSGDKTLVVEVTRLVFHKKYRKQYRDTKRYKVHDEKNKHQVGQKVEFVETRPISKGKKWEIVG